MAGITSKALTFGDPQNKKKYNGIEFENVLGIDEYEAQLRNLDPQVGRWWEIDPKVDNMEMWSPYVSNYNNPIIYTDPLGDEGTGCCWEAIKTGVGVFTGLAIGTIDNNLGSDIRGSVASTISDRSIAQGWNTGLNGADISNMILGQVESVSGSMGVLGSMALTGASGGLALEVSAPVMAVGLGMAIHGQMVYQNASANLISQNGRVKIEVEKEHKIPREQLNSPSKPGNAPTFKKDGKPVEVHHEGQNPKGPFKEMHPNDHRGKENYKNNHPNGNAPSKIDRKVFRKEVKEYWKKEFK